jgi:hypothetical protein
MGKYHAPQADGYVAPNPAQSQVCLVNDGLETFKFMKNLLFTEI